MKYMDLALFFILRVIMGLLLLSAGLEKVFSGGQWSAKEFLGNANGILAPIYRKLAGKRWVDFLNMWGLTFAGVALILGAFVKIAGILGAALMLLYYFGYKPKSAYYIFKDTLVYAIVLLFLSFSAAGFFWGLDPYFIRIVSPQFLY